MEITPFWIYRCPICGKGLQRVGPDSVLYNTPIYCRRCKVAHYPTIFDGRELDDDEPFPLN